jgi:hypothetical protein
VGLTQGHWAYYRGVVSSRTFKSLDNYLWTLTYKWATRGHANKPNLGWATPGQRLANLQATAT